MLTRDRQKANFVVSISVVRYVGGNLYGTANLLFTKADGDVVLADTFYQDRDSRADMAQEPITASWETLCPAPARPSIR